jgi:uncharacterized membrane protein
VAGSATRGEPAPRDRSAPRLASDTFRAWLTTGVGLALSFLATTGYVLLALRNGHEFDQTVVVALSGLTTILFVFVLYEVLTWRTFARASPSEFTELITSTTPDPDRARVLRMVNGGGASSWSVQAALMALVAVVVVSFVPVLRQNVLVVVLGFSVVVSSWVLVVFTYAIHYAREDASQPGLEFPGAKPLWWDYVYLSTQVSTTFSASDVTVTTTAMRRHVTAQCLIAFVFNTVIVALVVSALLTFVAAP